MKVQKVAVAIKQRQDISAGWSVVCSRDQQRSLTVKCVTFLSSAVPTKASTVKQNFSFLTELQTSRSEQMLHTLDAEQLA